MSNPDGLPAPDASLPNDAPPSCGRGARRGLWIAVAVAGAWWLALAGLAWFTANPVTLNVEQIRRADYVVTGSLSEERPDVIVVEREWKGVDTPGSLRIENLSQTAVEPERRYLFPLSRTRGDKLHVTATDLPENPPLVYPATEEAITQLTAILSRAAIDQSSSASGSAPER